MASDYSKQLYYKPKYDNGRYRGCVWHYDATGNYEKHTWLSATTYDTPEAAIDAAVEYLDDNGLDAEMAN